MTPITAPQTLPAAPVTRELALHLLNIQDRSPLAKLPIGAILKILSFLNPEDISAVSLSCRGLHAVSQDDHLWRSLFNSRFPTPLPTVMEKGACLKAYQHWHRVHPNLVNGVYALGFIINKQASVLRSLIWVSGTLISGYSDPTIKIWDINTGQCTKTLAGHTGSVNSLLCVNGMLISGSSDHTIRIWDINRGRCTKTLEGHTDEVTSLVEVNGMVISGSKDRTIKIWDINTGQCTKTLEGHTDEVTSLVGVNGIVISSSKDRNIKIWDINTGQCTKTLEDHTGYSLCLLLSDGKLFSGSTDHTIKIWDLKSCKCIKTLEGHHRSVSSLIRVSGSLISGSWDDTINIWDIYSGQWEKTLKENNYPVEFLVWAEGKLFSSCCISSIRIMNFNASDKVIFAEIASLFRTNVVYELTDPLFERFFGMPKKARDKIYAELIKILNPSDLESVKTAYPWGRSSTQEQKAQAIENYLNSLIDESDFSTKRRKL